MFGSSGDHGLSKRTQEYYTLNAAIDAIKARHRIARVSLAGQSGGSSAIAAILTLGRTDVVCAAPASGSFAVFERLDRLMTKAGRPLIHRMSPERYTDLYDVMRHLRHIKPAPERRILVIGDPKDQVTPFDLQQRFADGLRALNHHALLIEGEARDPEHHGLGHIAMKLAGACAAGIKDEELARLARTP